MSGREAEGIDRIVIMYPGFHEPYRDKGHGAHGVAKPGDMGMGVKPTKASSLVLCLAYHQASDSTPDMFFRTSSGATERYTRGYVKISASNGYGSAVARMVVRSVELM